MEITNAVSAGISFSTAGMFGLLIFIDASVAGAGFYTKVRRFRHLQALIENLPEARQWTALGEAVAGLSAPEGRPPGEWLATRIRLYRTLLRSVMVASVLMLAGIGWWMASGLQSGGRDRPSAALAGGRFR